MIMCYNSRTKGIAEWMNSIPVMDVGSAAQGRHRCRLHAVSRSGVFVKLNMVHKAAVQYMTDALIKYVVMRFHPNPRAERFVPGIVKGGYQ